MGLFYTQLRGTSCRARQSNLRVNIVQTGTYRYPDIVVVCGEPQFADDQFDTLRNPTLLIEVLSPTSELKDRGEKLREYIKLPSLQAYLLVAQDSARIEHFRKQADSSWIFNTVEGLEANIGLPALDCALSLAAVYDDVTFAAAEESQDER